MTKGRSQTNGSSGVTAALPSWIPLGLLVCALFLRSTSSCAEDTTARFDPSLDRIAPELWKASNHGRIPLREDGLFAFPEPVRRVVVDVGAYKLRRTGHYLQSKDTAVVAIEPMAEPWKKWPDSPRVIGLPVAISLERGTVSFHVNEIDVTSSLLESAEGGKLSTKTVETRDVPSVRLEDVLERIPAELSILFLKTDIQGLDLAALMSAGEQLRRVEEVQAEIVNDPSYEKNGPGSMATEKEFHDYMKSMGFSLVREFAPPQREAVDALYRNDHGRR